MRYGIISDIHGNLEAFETALDSLSHERIDRYLCIGDIVGYGADPVECIKKVQALHPIIICGNHDAACTGMADIRYFNEAARAAVVWTQQQLGEADLVYLKELNLVYENGQFCLVHGTLQEPEQFYYMFDAISAYRTFNLMKSKICFVGHSHVPGIFFSKNNDVKYAYKERIKVPQSKGEKLIVNVGSVGQPRDGDPRLCYCIYDTDKKTIELKRLHYDVEKAQKKILNESLPPTLAYRLSEGM